jgi:hypothetical protein
MGQLNRDLNKNQAALNAPSGEDFLKPLNNTTFV